MRLSLSEKKRALAAALVAASFGLGPASPRLIRCGEIPGSEALTAPLVLVGEIHGSAEIPAAFGNLVCHALARRPRETVFVGLEIFTSAQDAIDAFLASDGGAPARAALLEHEFWRREYQDGRSSQAMLALLEELRGHRAAGAKLHVRALDPPRYDSPSDRDAAMASAVSAAMDAAGGTAWICRSADAKDCGVREQGARSISGATPRIDLDSQPPAASGYNGTLVMGRLTASPPARTPARE